MANDFDEETPQETAALDAAAQANNFDGTEPSDLTSESLRARFKARFKTRHELESIALVPSVEQLAAKLSDLSDGLISAAYDQAKGLLIGNFGDWADGETMDKFDAVAAEYNLKPVHEDELGDVVAAYPGSVEVDLEAPLTHTQESIQRWSGYP